MNPEFDPEYEEIQANGNIGRIFGVQPGNFQSALHVSKALDDTSPNAIWIGGYDNLKVQELKLGPQEFFSSPYKIQVSQESLLAKKQFSDFFVNYMIKQRNYFRLNQEQIIYEADAFTKTILTDDYLTSAYYACNDLKSQLFFAKPNHLLFIEDIVLRYSLDDLKQKFYLVCKELSNSIAEDKLHPNLNNNNLRVRFQSISRQLYTADLYAKFCLYNASLLRKGCRIFNKNVLVTDLHFAKLIGDLAMQPLLPEFNEIFRRYIDSDQSSKKLSSLKKKIEEIQNFSTPTLQQTLDFLQQEYDFASREKPLYDKINSLEADEIIEKFVIAEKLVDEQIIKHLHFGNNIFEQTIFKDIIRSKYGTPFEILQAYQMINQKYSLEFHKIQNIEIQSVRNYPMKGRYKCVSYNDQILQHEKKFNQGKDLKLSTGLLKDIKTKEIIQTLYQEKIEEIIQRKEQLGQRQSHQRLMLQKFQKGEYLSEVLEEYKKLLVEANVELRLLKLPLSFQKYIKFARDKSINLFEELSQQSFDDYVGEITKKLDQHIKDKIEFNDIFGEDQASEDGDMNNVSNQMGFVQSMKKFQKGKIEFISPKSSEVRMKESIGAKRKILAREVNEGQRELYIEDDNSEHEIYPAHFMIGPNNSFNDFPQELLNLSIEELRELGAEEVTVADVQMTRDGQIINMSEEKKEQIKNIIDMLDNSDDTNQNQNDKLYDEESELEMLKQDENQNSERIFDQEDMKLLKISKKIDYKKVKMNQRLFKNKYDY